MNLDITKLIPQRAPFLFIDAISEVGDKYLITSFTIKDDTLLCRNDFLREAGVMENIAQTASAYIGYFSSDEPSVGVIGSVKKFQINRLPKRGENLQTHIVIVNEVFNITFLTAKVKIDEEVVATCEMKVAMT